MAQTSIDELTQWAATSESPFVTPPISIGIGGVDPLGLRQINFDLMDRVLPGLNNVARHIRPFVLVSWAWHRAIEIAKSQKLQTISQEEILDFVDRIDVIYVWSQFIRNPNSDLPGRQVLDQLLGASKWSFEGADWDSRRRIRRNSTALMAPINYGPALKSMGWILPHLLYDNLFVPSPSAMPAIRSFENQISEFLDSPTFNHFGPIEIFASDVAKWADAWALDAPTEPERSVMKEMLAGNAAPLSRQKGCALMIDAARGVSSSVELIRTRMAGIPSGFIASDDLTKTQIAWRKTQVRQLFRLDLEAIFFWAASRLVDGESLTTNELVTLFLEEYQENSDRDDVINWFDPVAFASDGPVDFQERLSSALDDPSTHNLPLNIVEALRFCLSEAPEHSEIFERTDRLPLAKAKKDAEAWSSQSAHDFLRNALEQWIFAQHVYWSVGRGLADARARGKSILRLKIVLEERGWTLAPGVARASLPSVTPDRLQTALMLAKECGLISVDTDI